MADGSQDFSTLPTYSMAERDRRWSLARDFMDEQDVEALLVFGEHEDNGPAPFNFDTWFTADRPGSIILFRRDGDPVPVYAAPIQGLDWVEEIARGNTPWIGPDDLRFGRQAAMLVPTMKELGFDKLKIGVVGLDPYSFWQPDGFVPYNLWVAILEAFPQAEFKSVGKAFTRLIQILSDEEIAVLGHSAAIGDSMARAMVETARPGISEAEIYAAGMAAANRNGAVTPQMHFWTGKTTMAIGVPTWAYRPIAPRMVEEGDKVHSEVFCCWGGLHSQHQAAIAIGKVHPDVERAAAVTHECYLAGLEALRPGNTMHDLAEAMIKPATDAGGWIFGPQFHGLNPMIGRSRMPSGYSMEGVKHAPKGPPPQVTDMGEVELQPGMSFSFEPSCGFGNHFVALGGTVVVGKEGAIEFNAYTSKMLRAEW